MHRLDHLDRRVLGAGKIFKLIYNFEMFDMFLFVSYLFDLFISYFTSLIHFTCFTVGGSAGLRGASEASLHTTVPGFEREDVSWSNRFKKSSNHFSNGHGT